MDQHKRLTDSLSPANQSTVEKSSNLASRKRSLSVSRGGQSRHDASDYPRRRVSVACETCRLRKTRCDAARPSCSFCVEIGANCSYRVPSANDRPSKIGTSSSLEKIMERLEQMENRILDVQNLVQPSQTQTHGSVSANFDWSVSACYHSNPQLHIPHHSMGSVSESPSGHEPDHETTFELDVPSRKGHSLNIQNTHNIALPTLGRWESLLPFHYVEYDNIEVYFRTEMLQGAILYGFTEAPSIDTTPKACWRLQRLFTKNILPWIPLFHDEYCLQQVNEASNCGFKTDDTRVALVMFVFALGAISNAEENTSDLPSKLPGISYFLEGCKIVDMNRSQNNSLISVQCRILWSMFLLFCNRPLQAWDVINEAMRDIIRLCHMRTKMESDSLFSEMTIRAYWACYLLEYELRGQSSFHGREFHGAHDPIKLPSSERDEPGFYYFLSEIALRQLLARVLDNIGFADGHTIYAPVVAFELCTQLSEWYSNLPSSLRFPLGSAQILDPQKAFLRAQYYSILTITKWAFIVRFVALEPDFRGEQDLLLSQGRECLDSAIKYIHTVETIMQFRHLLIFPNFIGLYCQTMLLLVTYDVPQLRQIQMEGAETAIFKALSVMRIWEENPSVHTAVQRIIALMERVGMNTDPPNLT